MILYARGGNSASKARWIGWLLSLMGGWRPDVIFHGDNKRLEIIELGHGFFRVVIHFVFMESPNVPQALRLSQKYNLKIEPDHTTYYIGRQTIVPNPLGGAMALWRKALFVFLANNAAQPITFYHLAQEQVVELGIRVDF